MWERKRRQYLCGFVPRVKDALNDDNYACMQPLDDLRVAVCNNKANKTLIEVLKTDLECGWSSADRAYVSLFMVALVLIVGGRGIK